jgi:reverse gyrase
MTTVSIALFFGNEQASREEKIGIYEKPVADVKVVKRATAHKGHIFRFH